MGQLLAYCGLDCGTCDARKAHLADDDELRAATAAKWTKDFHFEFTPEMIKCTGCRQEGVKFGHCFQCAMRACGLVRGVENCGACGEYATCPKILEFLGLAPQAKANLECYRAIKA